MNGQDLIVRVCVIGGCDVDLKDHMFQISVVILILIKLDRIEWILIILVGDCKGFAANECISYYDDGKEDEVDQTIFIG